jgi:hypothetical protein
MVSARADPMKMTDLYLAFYPGRVDAIEERRAE